MSFLDRIKKQKEVEAEKPKTREQRLAELKAKAKPVVKQPEIKQPEIKMPEIQMPETEELEVNDTNDTSDTSDTNDAVDVSLLDEQGINPEILIANIRRFCRDIEYYEKFIKTGTENTFFKPDGKNFYKTHELKSEAEALWVLCEEDMGKLLNMKISKEDINRFIDTKDEYEYKFEQPPTKKK